MPGNTSIRIADIECYDVEELGATYSGPSVAYTRTKSGPFHSRMRKVKLGELALHANHHVSSLVVEGVNPSDLVAIGFQTLDSVPRRVVGELFTNADVFVAGPNVEHLATVMSGQHACQIFIPATMFENEVAARLNRDQFDLTGQRYFLRPGKRGVAKLIDIVGHSVQMAQELIASAAPQNTLDQLQKSVVEQVVSILMNERNDLFQESGSFSTTEWVLLQTRAFLEENQRNPVRLADICRSVGVSQRTLQLAFAEGLGVSPMRYLKLRRLRSVRQRLLHTRATDVTVTLAAREAGFLDLSRFSRDYKKLFGDLPSEMQRLG